MSKYKPMFMQHLRPSFFLMLVTLLTVTIQAAAQNKDKDQAKSVTAADSLFWQGYNTCDLELQESLIADDIEFYHDKGGITLGKKDMLSSIQKNLCGPDFRLRREAVASTVKLHLLKSADTVYGALITGEHQFYVIPAGKNERLDGRAFFANLWLLNDKQWKLSRVFSYDHGPAKYLNKRKQIAITPKQLQKYVGTYLGKQSGAIVVKTAKDHLILKIGEKSFSVYPETGSLYFMKERDLTFSFQGNTIKDAELIISEYGQVVEKAKSQP